MSEEEFSIISMDIVVDKKQVPVRIDKYLLGRVENMTRTRLKKSMQNGHVLLNGNAVKSSYMVRPLDEIRVRIPKKVDYDGVIIPQDLDIDVVYEDRDVIVVNKRAGMVVHPGVGNFEGTLVNALAHYLKGTDLPIMEGNTEDRVGLVHRIDKDTSGLLVIAKTTRAMDCLAAQFKAHDIQRKYWALVWGNFEAPTGTITGDVGRHPRQRTKMAVLPEGTGGKRAVTHYKVLEDLYYVSLVECQLETGRTHQIRVHMQHQGHPIFSDARYGGDRILKGTVFTKYRQFVENCMAILPRQALHARTLGFTHPNGEYMSFEAELPADFQSALEKWQHYLKYRKNVLEDDEK